MNNTESLADEVEKLVGPTAYEEVSTADFVQLMVGLYGVRTPAQLAAQIRETRARLLLDCLLTIVSTR